MDDIMRKLGGEKCLIIAEVGQAHDGSLGMAHAFIDAVSDCGVDAIKFQTHIAEAESTPAEPWRVRFSIQDETRFEYWKRMEFTEEQWRGLSRHARENGLYFISSPFSFEAFELLTRVGVAAWKVASGEITNTPLLIAMAKTKAPIFLSSGMSTWSELDQAISLLRSEKANFALLQCTTQYPTPPEKVGLNVMKEMRKRYKCPVGLSDHTGTIYAGLAAVACGAKILEVHVTMSRWAFGPDVPASLTIEELHELVIGVRFIETVLNNPVDKNNLAMEMQEIREMFGKSIVARRNLPKGTILTRSDITLKKPGGGLPPNKFEELIGKTLVRPVSKDKAIQKEDLQ